MPEGNWKLARLKVFRAGFPVVGAHRAIYRRVPDLSAAALFVGAMVAFLLGVILGRLDRLGWLRIWD